MNPVPDVYRILPEVVLTLTGVAVMLLESVFPTSWPRRWLGWIAALGTTFALWASLWQLSLPVGTGFFGTVEIVPCQRLHVGSENQVGMTFPDFELMFLSGADGATDDLKDVRGSAALSIFEAHRNADDMGGAEFAGGARGNLGNETPIGKAARADLDGFEQTREGTASANRFAEIPVSENHGFSIGKVRRDDGHGDLEVFKAARFEHLFDKVSKAVIAGET